MEQLVTGLDVAHTHCCPGLQDGAQLTSLLHSKRKVLELSSALACDAP